MCARAIAWLPSAQAVMASGRALLAMGYFKLCSHRRRGGTRLAHLLAALHGSGVTAPRWSSNPVFFCALFRPKRPKRSAQRGHWLMNEDCLLQSAADEEFSGENAGLRQAWASGERKAPGER